MTLNIKNPETVEMAAEAAYLAGDSKTGTVRRALRELLPRLRREAAWRHGSGSLRQFLETEIWPLIPEDQLDRPPLTKAERRKVLATGRGTP